MLGIVTRGRSDELYRDGEAMVLEIFCLSPSGELPQPTTTRDIMTTPRAHSTFFIDPPQLTMG
ncbi:protein of unknown function [Methylococcus capsulatus]|uniref:Uncharacterized protein n=1 Tax=Methylococcus capsulatus TaxID=414 RepID=A0AA35URG3_METCP|nr:protein of unknown function [Methylococcus capsulatus]